MDSFLLIASQETACPTAEKFLNALSPLVKRPNLANRQLWGAKLSKHNVEICGGTVERTFTALKSWKSEIEKLISGSTPVTPSTDFQEQVFREIKDRLASTAVGDVPVDWLLTIRSNIYHARKKCNDYLELVLSNSDTNNGIFIVFPIVAVDEDKYVIIKDEICYHVSYTKEHDSGKKSKMEIFTESETYRPQVHEGWMQKILNKLVKWSEVEKVVDGPSPLQLIPLKRYNSVYCEMKVKYGKKLVETWQEKTNPNKFVFEEIAIASYLLVLFEEERKVKNLEKKQSFVDLGCGNGLLVYILANEGHPGKGIDVRKRAIWDKYGPEVILEEAPITPSDETLFKEFDWLIGNHSDELTPWIPVIAARSSYNCSYFVLPCCPHDFNGKFFDRQPGVSQYQSYLSYVKEVGVKCGFLVDKDLMRIPSTKRTCFIGNKRSYKEEEEESVEKERTEFIQQRCARLLKQQENSRAGDAGANEVENESEEYDDSAAHVVKVDDEAVRLAKRKRNQKRRARKKQKRPPSPRKPSKKEKLDADPDDKTVSVQEPPLSSANASVSTCLAEGSDDTGKLTEAEPGKTKQPPPRGKCHKKEKFDADPSNKTVSAEGDSVSSTPVGSGNSTNAEPGEQKQSPEGLCEKEKFDAEPFDKTVSAREPFVSRAIASASAYWTGISDDSVNLTKVEPAKSAREPSVFSAIASASAYWTDGSDSNKLTKVEPGKRKQTSSTGRPCKKERFDSEPSDNKYSAPEASVSSPNLSASRAWGEGFQPRASVEKVRNCTKVPRDLQDQIVNKVFHALLDCSDASSMVTTDGRTWNKGGCVPLGKVVSMFDKSVLSELKNNCGGLQTLLKNRYQIFKVYGSEVHLRYEDDTSLTKTRKINQKRPKTQLCWFHLHHPDGCPREAKDCLFAHGESDRIIP